MKIVAVFFSVFILIALIVLLITSLADIPEEAVRLRFIPKLSDPLLILLSSVAGLFFSRYPGRRSWFPCLQA